MHKKIIMLWIATVLISCARVQTLNLEKHDYSERPSHIIWFQIAGFSEEHIPLLRFNIPETNYKTNLEKIDCLGKMWSFNLYDLRPDSEKSFLSQLNGSKNITGQCDDYNERPVWDYLGELGYSSSILEAGASANASLSRSLSCTQKGIVDLSKVRFYKLAQATPGTNKFFHYQDSVDALTEVMKPGLYFDKSCQREKCYSSLSNDFKILWAKFTKERQQTFFLLRDFNFATALKKKDILGAKEALLEIEKALTWLATQKHDDVLLIITGAETLNIEYPKVGKEWGEYEKNGRNIIYKNSSVMSPVLAKGPMSENFCGLFEESEMLKRVIYRPKNKKFSWDYVNPLN